MTYKFKQLCIRNYFTNNLVSVNGAFLYMKKRNLRCVRFS